METTQPSNAAILFQNFNPLPDLSPTPINIKQLQCELFGYQPLLKSSLLASLHNGFDIGYQGPQFSLISKNLKSASQHPKTLCDNILSELMAKRVAGPYPAPPLKNFRTSPIGVVPKKNSNKFRTITDLSSPAGLSVNDYIPQSESTVHFNHFDEAVKIVANLGHGTLISKLDIKSAFRICPVRKNDWHLLGFSFQNLFFVDLCLPFGLRSSVNRFSQLADAVLWILKFKHNISHCTNYLDDYFIAGPAESKRCQENLDECISVFDKLGIPLAPEKVVSPRTVLPYLGIIIDTDKMELRLPDEKLSELTTLLQSFKVSKKITKRELLSLIGKLAFASKIVPSGRTFLRRLIDLSTSVTKLSHRITLNNDAREDIKWWLTFLPLWNGKQKILDPHVTLAPDIQLYTDASGQSGFGIYFDGRWIAQKWPPAVSDYSIQFKELFPIYLACYIWASEFNQKRLLFHCDNQTVTDIWQSGTSKCPKIMSLVRKLFFIAAKHNFTVNVKHIPGTNNSIADALSRLQMAKFFKLAPSASPRGTLIPPQAWNI